MNLAIIIVSWNTRDLLRRCVETVHASLAHSGIGYEIIVVDNASSDTTPDMLRAEHPEVRLIETGRNLGFAGGNNVALRLVLEKETGTFISSTCPENVLLLNPDTEVVGDSIPRMLRYLQAHPDVAVVGPRLRYPDGTVQSSRRRFPERGVFFLESTPLETYLPNNRWVRHYRMTGMSDDVEQDVDWLVGAALLVRRSAIERAGLMDEGFAMYSEELEWQLRIKRVTRGRIVYLPEAEVIHHEGKSSEQAIARRYINFHRSRIRYVNMTFGPQHGLGLWLFLLLVYTFELLVEAAKWALGHKRPLRARRIHTYAEFLRGMLAT